MLETKQTPYFEGGKRGQANPIEFLQFYWAVMGIFSKATCHTFTADHPHDFVYEGFL